MNRTDSDSYLYRLFYTADLDRPILIALFPLVITGSKNYGLPLGVAQKACSSRFNRDFNLTHSLTGCSLLDRTVNESARY